MLPPAKIWWKPLGRLEKSWLTISLAWCIFLSAMMPVWYLYGKQNVPTETYRATNEQFKAKLDAFVSQYQVGEDQGIPIVAPPPGDIYLQAQQWKWTPILQLEKGQTYRLHLFSSDVQHGFSLQPVNINLQVLPGYVYVATLVPTTVGEFKVICNEYCLLGHHIMVGKINVSEK